MVKAGKRKAKFSEIALTVLRLREIKSEETRKAARQWIPRLIEFFGSVWISEMTEELWVEYVARERERRPRKFFDDRKYMRMILRFAELRGFLARKVELPIPDPPWDAGREITRPELRRLRRAAAPTPESPDLRFQIDIGWKMGLRLREMLRLRWDQIDWKNGCIHFSPARTKTRRARIVPLNPDLIAQFLERRALSAALFVFPNPKDTSRPQNNNKTAWRRCKAKARVTARWHDLRHTSATVMLRRGIPRHIVRRYLGMSNRVLDRIYTHLSIEDLQSAAITMSEQPRKKTTRLPIRKKAA